MKADERTGRLEWLLAAILARGTWLASVLIAGGMVVALIGRVAGAATRSSLGWHMVTAGVALLILLPVFRVVVMLVFFLRERDYRLGAVAAVVLAILLTGLVLGILPAG